MTIKHRIARLEQRYGRSEETVELFGMTMTAAEFDALLREIAGTTTQARIDPNDNAP